MNVQTIIWLTLKIYLPIDVTIWKYIIWNSHDLNNAIHISMVVIESWIEMILSNKIISNHKNNTYNI